MGRVFVRHAALYSTAWGAGHRQARGDSLHEPVLSARTRGVSPDFLLPAGAGPVVFRAAVLDAQLRRARSPATLTGRHLQLTGKRGRQRP